MKFSFDKSKNETTSGFSISPFSKYSFVVVPVSYTHLANILETVVFADGETANTQQATGTQTAADPNATQQVNPVMSTIVSGKSLISFISVSYTHLSMAVMPAKAEETVTPLNASRIDSEKLPSGNLIYLGTASANVKEEDAV